MFGAGVDEQLAHLGATKTVLGNHSLDGFVDQCHRVGVDQGLPRGRAKTTRVTRVVVVKVLGGLVGRDHDLVGVHDDHEVAGVHVGGEERAVLAAQQ